jgi:hypothetical protein
MATDIASTKRPPGKLIGLQDIQKTSTPGVFSATFWMVGEAHRDLGLYVQPRDEIRLEFPPSRSETSVIRPTVQVVFRYEQADELVTAVEEMIRSAIDRFKADERQLEKIRGLLEDCFDG